MHITDTANIPNCMIDLFFCCLFIWLFVCLLVCLFVLFAVITVPSSCNITLSYNQTSEKLLFITSSWNTVPVSHQWATSVQLSQNILYTPTMVLKFHYKNWNVVSIWHRVPVKGIFHISIASLLLGHKWPMSRLKWEHHTVPDQIPDWVCCGYWECEHCQVHSWEV